MVKDWIVAYGKELVQLTNEMSPYLLLGFFFAGALRVFFPRRVINRYMGGSNFRSALNAALLGIPMPLCSCGVLPAGIGFYKNGASRGSTVSFLISTPQTGVDSVIATYAMLGLPLAIIRPFVALVTGVAGGILANTGEKEGGERVKEDREDEVQERSLKELFRYGFVELLQDISRWLIIGMAVAALLAVLIPSDFFVRHISNEYLAMLVMLAASVPLYVCATGSIPIAAVLLLKGLSPGAALVLLMAGPATNFATMTVIGKTMGRRSLRVYLGSIIGGALLFGILVNEFVPRSWIMDNIPIDLAHGVHEHANRWFQWLSSVLLVLLMVNGYIMKWIKSRKARAESLEGQDRIRNIHSFRVEGMTCSKCKASLEEKVSKLPAVSRVYADPGKKMLTLESDGLSEEALKEAVESLGYSYKGRIIRF